MAKKTEKRLIKTLEFLKEPRGSTIPTIVKAMKGEEPQVSLKKIVQTLRGCLENGIMKMTDARVMLKQMDEEGGSGARGECTGAMGGCPSGAICSAKMAKAGQKNVKPKVLPNAWSLTSSTCEDAECISHSKICMADGEPPDGGGEEPNPDGQPPPEPPPAPEKPKRCRKPKPKCKKKKPKCPKPKPKCPKPKPKCPKPKPKCPKPKPKCPKPKKCVKRKIQPYCKKKKKCDSEK